LIEGKSDCAQFTAGNKFTLERHFDADASYLLTRVEHEATDEGYRSDHYSADQFTYENSFTCIPETLRYRPQRVTRVPVIEGAQTATVVGPPGEEIWVDKYGRVKVQFHWDRKGKMNADSSCWLRVAQVWAGNGWGSFFWPRIGHEVVVVFEEGDPDQPLIIGSVYNADNMPWYTLPINKQLGGIKSESVRGTAKKNYNAIVFNDEKGKEHISIHSEHNLSLNSEFDKMIHAGRHKGERVALANVLTVGKIVPLGGGSGGGGMDQGNAMQPPAPAGLLGLDATFTYGASLQAACPLNHQLAVGSNFQMCINPAGLAAGAGGSIPPSFMQVLAGSGMGGNMQFTIGSSAQFTLGQSFEISVGPPKIEIHADYKGHLPVSILCGVLGAMVLVFTLAYDLLKGDNDAAVTPTPQTPAPATSGESSGDRQRVTLMLVYQLAADVMLAAILAAEAIIDNIDWLADDTMKGLYLADQSCFNLWTGADMPKGDDGGASWIDWGVLGFGCVGAVAIIVAEVALMESN
jgi:hypothetical protein